jgi:hypothetical protein
VKWRIEQETFDLFLVIAVQYVTENLVDARTAVENSHIGLTKSSQSNQHNLSTKLLSEWLFNIYCWWFCVSSVFGGLVVQPNAQRLRTIV